METKKKMGRPTNDPKTGVFQIRTSKEETEMLEYCVSKTGMKKAEVIRSGIREVYEGLTKGKERKEEMFNVYLNTRGIEELVFRGERKEADKWLKSLEKECRAADEDGIETGCYMYSDGEIKRQQEARDFWDTLSTEDKKDMITVDGRKYVRKIWEHNHQGK